jgi:hypothetical protein
MRTLYNTLRENDLRTMAGTVGYLHDRYIMPCFPVPPRLRMQNLPIFTLAVEEAGTRMHSDVAHAERDDVNIYT